MHGVGALVVHPFSDAFEANNKRTPHTKEENAEYKTKGMARRLSRLVPCFSLSWALLNCIFLFTFEYLCGPVFFFYQTLLITK